MVEIKKEELIKMKDTIAKEAEQIKIQIFINETLKEAVENKLKRLR